MNTTIEFCIFDLILVANFSLNWQSLLFGPNFFKKGISGLKQEHYHSIMHIRISLATKFQLKLTIWFFGPKLLQSVFMIKKPRKSEHHRWILHIQISQGTKFNFKKFWILGRNLPKKGFSDRKYKSEHHHWILHIRINLGTKFQLKLTILNFWIKFGRRGYFQSKMEKVKQI